jgi:hypothetical protein
LTRSLIRTYAILAPVAIAVAMLIALALERPDPLRVGAAVMAVILSTVFAVALSRRARRNQLQQR